MVDREKVIKGLKLCRYDPDPGQENKWYHSCLKCPYCWSGPETEMFTTRDCWRLFSDAIDLLKEQEDRIGVLTRAIKHMPKLTKLLDVYGDGYAKVVRCKDCLHGDCFDSYVLCRKSSEKRQEPPEWFCADGERKVNME